MTALHEEIKTPGDSAYRQLHASFDEALPALLALAREGLGALEQDVRTESQIHALVGYIESSVYFGAKEVKCDAADLDNWLDGLRQRSKSLDDAARQEGAR